MKMKKILSLLLAGVMVLGLLAGCGGGFDASGYVRGVLNNIYLGDSAE